MIGWLVFFAAWCFLAVIVGLRLGPFMAMREPENYEKRLLEQIKRAA